MVTGLSRLGGATAHRAAAAALSRSGLSPLTRCSTQTKVVNPATAPSMPTRLGFSPFLPGSPRGFCRLPPAGSTPSEAEIFENIKLMEEVGNTRARVLHAHNEKVSQDIYEVSKSMGIAGSAARESVGQTATATVAVLGLFVTSALLLVYGIIGRSESKSAKGSASSKSAEAAAEATAAAEKATAAAEKATAAAEKVAASMTEAADKISLAMAASAAPAAAKTAPKSA